MVLCSVTLRLTPLEFSQVKGVESEAQETEQMTVFPAGLIPDDMGNILSLLFWTDFFEKGNRDLRFFTCGYRLELNKQSPSLKKDLGQ